MSDAARELAEKLCDYLPKKQVAKVVAEIHQEKKNKIYSFLLDKFEKR
ncbi:MAG: hypothetical protein ACPGJI_07730 [Kangiellaceae bacterium]